MGITTTADDSNRDLVRRYPAAFDDRDRETMAALLAATGMWLVENFVALAERDGRAPRA